MTVKGLWWKRPLIVFTAVVMPGTLATALDKRADVIHRTEPETARRLRDLASDLVTTRRRDAIHDLVHGRRSDRADPR